MAVRDAELLSARPASPARSRRSAWLGSLYRWHWISSALCLVGMMLFAMTGITLNHAADIGARPVVDTIEGRLPEALSTELRMQASAGARRDPVPVPETVRRWLRRELGIETTIAPAEWSADELYLAMPRPGGDAWLRIGLSDGELEYERTDRGWIAYFNDLHKGRHTGRVWSGFLDLFSVAAVVFSLTGLAILALHAGRRPLVWPVIGLGGLIPFLLIVLFIH